MNKLEAVIFDFDNTLVDYVRSDVSALQALANILPADVDSDQFIDVAVESLMYFHRLVAEGSEHPSAMHRFRLARTVQTFGLGWDERYLQDYMTAFLGNTYVQTGAQELLTSLHGRVRLGLLTNAYDPIEQRLRITGSGLADYFDCIVVCSEIGHYKPDKQAFLHVCNALDAAPNVCVYVGDSETHDVRGGKAANLLTIKLDPKTRTTLADYRCKDLAEVGCVLSALL